MKKGIEKRFIVRKYIMAVSASDALKKDRKYKADDVYIDEDWIKQQSTDKSPAIGFSVERNNEDDW